MPDNAASERPLSERAVAQLGRTVIQSIPDAVIYADRNGIIRFWNAGATRIFGFSTSEVISQSLDIIIPQRLRQRHWDSYHRMMATGRSQHAPDELLSVPAQTKAGETLSIQFTVAPVPSEDGQVAGVVAVLRDVTPTFQELKRLRAKT